jgi:23S rRNA pseudouridine1911/1915/1917 synthase
MPSQPISLATIIPENLHGTRLDQALAILFPDYSRARLQTWIRDGKVMVDEKRLRAKDKVQTGQQIHIETILEAAITWEGQAIQLDIIYEDKSLLIVNKPAGLVVHPAAGNPDSTLVNALLHHAPELKNLPRAGIVHRLDKDTSGLLVVARTLPAHTYLTTQIQAHNVKREYLAIVNGTFTAGGVVDAAMGRHPRQRTKMAVVESGKHAVTHYRIFERFRAHTALQIFLETGRTHQIRVHMAHIAHALVGDPLYGNRLKIPAGCSDELQQLLRGFKRQALHAKKLSFIHPDTGEEMQWEAAIPGDIEALMACLRENALPR